MEHCANTLETLRQTRLFSTVSDDVLCDMMQQFRKETWARRRAVSSVDIADRCYFILSGRLQVIQINRETGRMVTLSLLATGDVFDVIQLLNGSSSDSLFEARDNLELVYLPIEQARQWIIDNPEFNRQFLPYLGRRMNDIAQLAGDLALHDTETRLAHLIMRYLDNEDPERKKLRLINDLPHEVLAEMIGSVRAVVNRQLQHWRKRGIINLDKGAIRVKNLEAILKRVKSYQLPPPDGDDGR